MRGGWCARDEFLITIAQPDGTAHVARDGAVPRWQFATRWPGTASCCRYTDRDIHNLTAFW
jgi:hypothetical protein